MYHKRCHIDTFSLLVSTTALTVALFCLKLLVFVIREFYLFAVGSSPSNCPSARCAIAANVVYKGTDIFSKQLVSLHHIVKFVLLLTISLSSNSRLAAGGWRVFLKTPAQFVDNFRRRFLACQWEF
jgi:hypothetical protein